MDHSSVSDAWHPPFHYESEMHWISACQFPSAMKEPCYYKTEFTVITTTIPATNILSCYADITQNGHNEHSHH